MYRVGFFFISIFVLFSDILLFKFNTYKITDVMFLSTRFSKRKSAVVCGCRLRFTKRIKYVIMKMLTVLFLGENDFEYRII